MDIVQLVITQAMLGVGYVKQLLCRGCLAIALHWIHLISNGPSDVALGPEPNTPNVVVVIVTFYFFT